MDFNIALDPLGWGLVIVGGLVVGAIIQLIGDVRFPYEWLLTAVAGIVGAIVASEFVIGFRTFEPVWGGLALIPALAGGVIVGVLVAAVTRYATEGSLFHSAHTLDAHR
jgi:uncharacterized membrane protein YeaQ/YmgE (transglycosylase-associated protein family)